VLWSGFLVVYQLVIVQSTLKQDYSSSFKILMNSKKEMLLDSRRFDVFVNYFKAYSKPVLISNSFVEFIQQFTQDLSNGKFEFLQSGELLTYPVLSSLGSDVTTRGIRIRANALFIPEMSKKHKKEFFFAYRIRKKSLQLKMKRNFHG
jgi:hypothetical protein